MVRASCMLSNSNILGTADGKMSFSFECLIEEQILNNGSLLVLS